MALLRLCSLWAVGIAVGVSIALWQYGFTIYESDDADKVQQSMTANHSKTVKQTVKISQSSGSKIIVAEDRVLDTPELSLSAGVDPNLSVALTLLQNGEDSTKRRMGVQFLWRYAAEHGKSQEVMTAIDLARHDDDSVVAEIATRALQNLNPVEVRK